MKKNVKEIEFRIEGKEWEDALDNSFKKNSKDIKVDGFRKGQVPKDIFIKKFGLESLFNDAIDEVLETHYQKEIEKSGIKSVVRPIIDVTHVCAHDVDFKLTLIEKPEVKLGDYKKINVKKETVSVSKEEIEKEIESLREKYADIIEDEKAEIKEGYTAVIDFKGVVDGKELEGGTGENYPLEIGSKTFIEGFEEGLIGLKKGDSKVLNLTFPKDYVEDLAGKDVEFTVEIKEVKVRNLPELNESFFKDLGLEDVTTVNQFEDHISKDLLHKKEHEVEDKYLDKIINEGIKLIEVDINDEIIDYELDALIDQYNQQLQMQGITLEQYLPLLGKTLEEFKAELKPNAEERVKSRYFLEAVSEKENIEVTEDEYNNEVSRMSEMYGMEKEEFLKLIEDKEIIKLDIKMRKTLDILKK